jgi:hypothetical protein
LDRLKEQSLPASGVTAGSKCTSEAVAKNCLNLKAELYFNAKKLFEQDRLKIINRPELLKELRLMKKEYQSTGKVKIVDPDKSPDFLDSLVYGLFQPNFGTFIILSTRNQTVDGVKWH